MEGSSSKEKREVSNEETTPQKRRKTNKIIINKSEIKNINIEIDLLKKTHSELIEENKELKEDKQFFENEYVKSKSKIDQINRRYENILKKNNLWLCYECDKILQVNTFCDDCQLSHCSNCGNIWRIGAQCTCLFKDY